MAPLPTELSGQKPRSPLWLLTLSLRPHIQALSQVLSPLPLKWSFNLTTLPFLYFNSFRSRSSSSLTWASRTACLPYYDLENKPEYITALLRTSRFLISLSTSIIASSLPWLCANHTSVSAPQIHWVHSHLLVFELVIPLFYLEYYSHRPLHSLLPHLNGASTQLSPTQAFPLLPASHTLYSLACFTFLLSTWHHLMLCYLTIYLYIWNVSPREQGSLTARFTAMSPVLTTVPGNIPGAQKVFAVEMTVTTTNFDWQ